MAPVVGSVSAADRAIPVATDSNMQALTLRYWQTRDPRLREVLVLFHQRLVHYVAARFIGGNEALEDLIQVGNIGLINALDRYDPSRDVRFSTYAMPTIVGEIKRHFRDKTWHVKVPRWLQEMSANARKAQQTLSGTLGRPPTIREIAAHLKASEEDILEALEVSHISRAVSLDTRMDPQTEGDGGTLMDLLGRTDGAIYDVAAYSDLRRALEFLDERERQVLHLRFFEELSQAKISRQLGISQMHVSRLQQRALRRLRHLLADEPRLPERTVPRRSSSHP
jgi:RNA polymerase sigma-B factor